MLVIVAHRDDCEIVTKGTVTESSEKDDHAGSDQRALEPIVCTCGGVMIRVPEDDATRMGQASVFTDNGHLYA